MSQSQIKHLPVATEDELDRIMKRVAANAPALRKGGVRSLKYCGLELDLLPFEAPAPAAPRGKPEPAMPSDPLDDPMSYPGGAVPSLLRDLQNRRAQAQVSRDEHEDDDDEHGDDDDE